MKSLAQIEPRTPISSLPYTITNPGSYYLTTNLSGVTGQGGIIIQADRVSIDLAGFALVGVAGSLSGLVVPAGEASLEVRNGTIANWGATGVDAANARNSQFDHLRLAGNGSHGLIAGFAALVRDCLATGNLGDGIRLTSAGFALNNNCQTNGSSATTAGLHVLGNDNRIEANHVGLNVGLGFKVDGTQNLLVKNSAYGNTVGNYSIVTGNDYGQLLSGLGAGFVNSNPWANFSSGPAAPTCSDGIKNGNETDVDCGGGTCPPCATGKACLADTDCQSGPCVGGVCQGPAPTCSDGIKNGSETDVDCGGGTCPPCATGKACLVDTDCQSGPCVGGVCQGAAPTCSDLIKNGSETDVDCGGGTCPACANGKHCSVASDCQSHVCFGGLCQTPTCTDTVKNGNETDVDCGGGTCSPCGTGKQCLANSDCISSVCSGGLCQ